MSRSSLVRPTLLFGLLLASLPAIAQSSSPTFTITTSNVSLSAAGTAAGSIPYTLTSVNGYTGTITVTCTAPVVPAGVRIPYCIVPTNAAPCNPPIGSNPPPPNVCTLTANQAFPSNFSLIGNSVATAGFGADHNPAFAILLVIALLAGLTLRRNSARRLTLPICLLALAALAATTGCGNIPQGFTPGTYTYVIGATQSPAALYIGANATVTIH